MWLTKPLWTEVFWKLKIHYEKYKGQLTDAIGTIETIVWLKKLILMEKNPLPLSGCEEYSKFELSINIRQMKTTFPSIIIIIAHATQGLG